MLVLNEDQRMLMDSARGAIAAKAPIAMWRQLRAEASPDGFSRAFWRECAEMGWTGVLVPQEFGGIDFGVTGAGLIAREMARTLAPSPFLSTAVLAASALRRSELGGGEGQVAAAHRQRGSDRRVRHRRRPPSDRPDAGDGGEIRPGLAGHGRQAFRAGRPCGGRLCRRIAKVRGYARAVSRRGRRARAHARRAHAGRQQARRQRRTSSGCNCRSRRRARRRLIDRGDARRRPRGRCRGAVRRRRGGVRADDELSQGAQAIRSQNRQFPGAAASCGARCISISRTHGRRR